MKKGIANWVVQFIGALLILVISALIIWGVLYGNVTSEPSEFGEEPVVHECKTSDDCDDVDPNSNGTQCIIVYPGDFLTFCGCLTNDDCEAGGECGPNNRCS